VLVLLRINSRLDRESAHGSRVREMDVATGPADDAQQDLFAWMHVRIAVVGLVRYSMA